MAGRSRKRQRKCPEQEGRTEFLRNSQRLVEVRTKKKDRGVFYGGLEENVIVVSSLFIKNSFVG